MEKKLHSQSGESLTELLISVLVVSLGLAMFAVALSTSRQVLASGTEKIGTYYEERNGLEAENSEKEAAGTLVVEEDGKNRVDLGAPSGNGGTGSYLVRLYHGDLNSANIWRYGR